MRNATSTPFDGAVVEDDVDTQVRMLVEEGLERGQNMQPRAEMLFPLRNRLRDRGWPNFN